MLLYALVGEMRQCFVIGDESEFHFTRSDSPNSEKITYICNH